MYFLIKNCLKTFFGWINCFVLDEKIFENRLFEIPLKGLRLFGYMISKDQKFWKVHCFRGALFTLSFVLFNIFQYVDLYQTWGNLDVMMENASTTLLFTTTLVRMFSFYRNRSRYFALLKEADDEISEILDKNHRGEVKILFNIVKYFKILALGFISIAIITANGMNLNSFVQSFFYNPEKDASPPLILRSWVPFDIWSHFYSIYAWQFYIMWLGIIIVSSWHTFILSLMCYCIAFLKILNHRMENFDEYVLNLLPFKEVIEIKKARNVNFLKNFVVYDTKADEIFEEIIKKHQKLLKFIKKLSKLMAIYVFIDFIIFSGLICALLYETSTTDEEVQKVLGVCYIVTMSVILWIHYWHANEISYYNSELSRSMFRSNWYTQSLTFQKMFLMFSQANTPPLKIKAFALVITMQVFIGIFRASYSYFTLLSRLNKKHSLMQN
ncbi:odorant receptor 56a-like [Culicoides brevitarsis]|uniref:odorant receptor 56a-like n=1 Tax=Culicoides brevitarsis TaxID=469753 RepID=UPI00307CAC29